MNKNGADRRRLYIVISRRSSLAIVVTLLNALLWPAAELACAAGLVGLAAGAVSGVYTDMEQLSVRRLSIEEKSRAIDQDMLLAMVGGVYGDDG
jgi:hypothetical protein